jgi:hypothetical protein
VTCGRSVVSPVSSINKTDRHDITGTLLKVALSNHKINQPEHLPNMPYVKKIQELKINAEWPI